ncbi:hypothetical protein [Pedobacter xixiisoli]|uniref:DUF5689 domain-containing protein n=1 Tax=Pedobacter xixiisoli TaxID=1476464 RepID=A0A285ZZ26_9SPHI|nr:hypothetical protein [Pedobacter xixiisoli]SOD14900.1 hypothetical protein SAMN06297358_1864 [Pedobacter xixiisoli]
MKKILNPLLFCFLALVIIASCKKNELIGDGEGTIETKEYIFNRATKTFETGDKVTSNISAANGVKFVYTYLVRTGQPNVLVHVADNSKLSSNNFELSMPVDSIKNYNLTAITGLKVLAKLGDNSSLEGFIPVKYLDPALPQFSTFPSTINADPNGTPTAITGTIKSEFGIKQVDILDDQQTENTYVLVNSITGITNVKEYALNYAYTYRKAAQHIKVRAIDIYNQANEIIINMPVDVTIFKPKLQNFPASVATTATSVAGLITSVTGLKKVDIYDDRNGAYQLLSTVNNLNGVKTYNYSSSYTFKMRASNIKIIAVDIEDVQTELVIPINITYQSVLYRDIVMSAQGTSSTGSTNSMFIAETGKVLGNCELGANEETAAFLMYGGGNNTTTPSSISLNFYSPTNLGTSFTNYRCNGVSWVRNPASNFKATRFRVLVKGASTTIDKIYADIDAGNVDVMDAAYFTSISAPSGQSAPSYHASSQVYNVGTASIIYAQIPIGGVMKNALIKVKELTVHDTTAGLSSIKFDIYIQK